MHVYLLLLAAADIGSERKHFSRKMSLKTIQ